jgi:hypothetical protein
VWVPFIISERSPNIDAVQAPLAQRVSVWPGVSALLNIDAVQVSLAWNFKQQKRMRGYVEAAEQLLVHFSKCSLPDNHRKIA